MHHSLVLLHALGSRSDSKALLIGAGFATTRARKLATMVNRVNRMVLCMCFVVLLGRTSVLIMKVRKKKSTSTHQLLNNASWLDFNNSTPGFYSSTHSRRFHKKGRTRADLDLH